MLNILDFQNILGNIFNLNEAQVKLYMFFIDQTNNQQINW